MFRDFIVMILANVFNVIDLVTTVYAVNVLGFKELNVCVDMALRNNLMFYAVFKLGSLVVLSFVYVLSLRSRHPFLIGVKKGCIISFYMMCVILGLASFLNTYQIVFGGDVTTILVYIAKMLPTLKL